MKKVLLCPPTYYDIEYEINPWMDVENKVDQMRVKSEFVALKTAYEHLGLEIWEINQVKGVPDMVYSANFGFANGEFIKSNYKYNERKKEAEFAKVFFTKKGYTIAELPDHITFEGQGDLLTDGKRFFFGWGKRSDATAKDYLEKILRVEIYDFQLVNPYYYHLDTCFAPLNHTTVAINPISFTPEGRGKIKHLFENVIEVSTADNHLIACNLVVVDKIIVIGKGITQKLKDDFARYGFTTYEVPMDEYRKGGGSVKCLTLEIY